MKHRKDIREQKFRTRPKDSDRNIYSKPVQCLKIMLLAEYVGFFFFFPMKSSYVFVYRKAFIDSSDDSLDCTNILQLLVIIGDDGSGTINVAGDV